MVLFRQLILGAGIISLSSFSDALWISPDNLDRDLLSSYDFVIAGGGISGVVVANRLTENPNSMQIHPLPCRAYWIIVTVLVLESGML